MSETGAFCPSCGAPTGDAAVAHGAASGPDRRRQSLCDACYLETFALADAPDEVTVTVCARCGAVQRGSTWEDIGADDYTDVAIGAVSDALAVHVDADDIEWGVEPEQAGPNTIRMRCSIRGAVRGEPVAEELVIPVHLSRGTCTRCSRIAGDYYAGVVQVRATDREPTPEEADRAVELAGEVVAAMEETGDRNAFVTEVREVPGGVDIKVSTTKIGAKVARRVVAEFGGGFESSETLVTRDEDGSDVYRVTYAVRLPAYVPGEVIDPGDGDGPVLVRSVRGNLKGLRLGSGAPYERALPIEGARRLGHRDDAEETALVSIEDDHAVQVLDPETARAETVSRPAFLDPSAETVPVLKSRAGLHVLPEP